MKTILVLGAVLVLPTLAAAQVRHVDRDAAPGGDGLAWASAYDDLQEALSEARVNPGVTEVWVAEGRYRPTSSADRTVAFELVNGLALYGGFTGSESAREERNPVVHVTVLDGDLLGDDQPGFVNYGDNSYHVVRASGVDASAVFDGFTLRGGSGAQGLPQPGAGFLCYGTPTLRQLVFRDNSSLGGTNDGGGMYLELAARDLAVLEDCAFLDNRSTDGGGAKVRANFGGEVRFLRCVFSGNSGTSGAALSVIGSWTGEASARVELEACVVSANASASGGGVSFHAEDHCEALVRGSEFRGNTGCTGAALTSSSGMGWDLQVEECSFFDNGSVTGCGIGAGGPLRQLRGSLALRGCRFGASRRAHVSAWGVDLTVERCSFNQTGNAVGLVLDSGSTAHLERSIVWGSKVPQIELNTGSSATADWCDIALGGTPLAGTGNIELDPLFVDAAGFDLHLAPGSPCIDVSPLSFGPGADFERDPSELDGDLDGTLEFDMGADEHNPVRLSIQGPTSAGSTLTIDLDGPPGFAALLAIGSSGRRFIPGVGTLFLNLTGSLRVPWPAAPSSVPVLVPPGLLGLYHAQALVFGGGVFVPSNYVPLTF